jgi:hypothetical protein
MKFLNEEDKPSFNLPPDGVSPQPNGFVLPKAPKVKLKPALPD